MDEKKNVINCYGKQSIVNNLNVESLNEKLECNYENKKVEQFYFFLRPEKEKEYQDAVANPYVAAQRGYIDDIIEPSTTRFRIIRALGILQNKRDTNPMKKHGNIPL